MWQKDRTPTPIACGIHHRRKLCLDLESVQLHQHAYRITDEVLAVAIISEQFLEVELAQLLCEVEQRLVVCHVGFEVLDNVEDGVRVALYLGSFHEA